MMDHKYARELLHAGKHLPPKDGQSLEAHLKDCQSCQEYADFLSRLERELPTGLPGVAFSQAELGRVSSAIATKMRRRPMRTRSLEGFKLAAWGAAAVLLVLVLSWGIQNLMPQTPAPAGLPIPTESPSPYPPPHADQTTPTPSPQPTEAHLHPTAQDLSLTTADLGAGWHLDVEVTDTNERYFMERGEDGRAIIWTEQKGNPLMFDLESVETVSMRGFSHPEEKLVLFQVVAVFDDITQAEAETNEPQPCEPPCEHRNEYSDGSGEITYYREILIGDESSVGIITDIADPHPPFISFILFRKDRVLVTLISVAQWDDPENAPPVDEGRLEGFARIIEANISSAFISSPQEVLEPSPTPTHGPEAQTERLQPSLTGELLSLAGWSPDGGWLVYWTPEPPDPDATGFIELAYRLGFYHPDSGQRCRYDEITTTRYSMMVDWHPDGRWGFRQDGRFLAGLPCDDPEPVDPAGFLTYDMPDLSISPDGRYQAVTIQTGEEDGLLTYTTSLVDLETGQPAVIYHADSSSYTNVHWRIPARIGSYDNFLGGEWLTERIFLLYETYDEGPLLLAPDERVVQVSPEFFGEPPGYQVSKNYSRRASGSPHPDGENFHMLLHTVGVEWDHLYLKLYHSETGEVEELPYRRAWGGGFFQDWLFLDPREIIRGYETNGIWARSVDPPGSEGSFLASNIRLFQVNPDLDRLVYSDDQDRLTLISFPDGEILQSWETPGYGSGWIYWSPAGGRIATSGQAVGRQEVGIFVIEVD